MEVALLIGNGLNCCYEGMVSWSDLLKNIAGTYEVKFNEDNSFSLEFESIINQILLKKDDPNDTIYEEVKKKIAHEVTRTQPEKESLHELFVKRLDICHILTTNYDYMLELVLDSNYMKNRYPNGTREVKYSLYRQTQIGNMFFYHIHGEARYPSTLCLGYEHYAGYLAKMRRHMKEICDDLKYNCKSIVKNPKTWLSLFFTHNIYIVGFGLNPCEIDLWWLLTFRAYLYYSNAYDMKKYIKNRIKIYIINSTKKIAEQNELDLLENLHVEYETASCRIVEGKEDYLSVYKEIADHIKSEMKAS